MNISSLQNNNTNFRGVYVSETNMGKQALKLANMLEDEISYTKQADKLDKKGVDIFILSDDEHPQDQAKILFRNNENQLYKINGKDCLKTKRLFKYPGSTLPSAYSTNAEQVLDTADKIINNEITQTTKRPTKNQQQLDKEFPFFMRIV